MSGSFGLKVAPKIAIVHDWLNGMRGGEAVLNAILELFPAAAVYTLVAEKNKLSGEVAAREIYTSFLQKIPGGKKYYRHFLPLMPSLVKSIHIPDSVQIVISSSHCVAKGVRIPKGAVHLSYVHAPMRYVWDRFEDYFGEGRASFPVQVAAKLFRKYLQNWDRKTSSPGQVDVFVANSKFIASQIRAHYGRDAKVIYPFCDVAKFSRLARNPGEKYLMIGAFAPNKRVDLAVDAFRELNLPLQIIGSGPGEGDLRRRAGPRTEFLGSRSSDELPKFYSQCRAFVFPGIEDCGITPMEAMCAGAPVIAFRAGGALETLTEKTALFFDEPSVESLKNTISIFESNPELIKESESRARGAIFSKERFQREFTDVLKGSVSDFLTHAVPPSTLVSTAASPFFETS